MSEINFVEENKKEEKKKERDKPSRVEFSKPKEEDKFFPAAENKQGWLSSLAGIFDIFKKGDPSQRPALKVQDSANRELWKKVVGKRPSQPESPSFLENAKKSEESSKASEKKTDVPPSLKGARSPGGRPGKSNNFSEDDSRQYEETMLMKNLKETKKNGDKTATPPAPTPPPPTPRKAEQIDDDLDELDILQTNLIKDQSLGFVDWKRNLYPIIFSVVFPLLVIILAYGGIMYWGIKNIEQTKIDPDELLKLENNIEKGMDSINKEQVLLSEKKFPAAKHLVENHIYWTNFFAFLEENTLETVNYSGFSGNTGGQYSFAAQAKDVKSAAEQVKVLSSHEWVVDSTTYGLNIGAGKNEEDGALGGKNVSFSLTLNIDPKHFKDFLPDKK